MRSGKWTFALGLAMLPAATSKATHEELSWCLRAARAPCLRTVPEFAEGELVIPEGKHRGSKWRGRIQPYGKLLFEAVSSGPWRRSAVLGCVQSGKSLHGFVTPILYHLFEWQEPLVCGGPTMDVCRDKWRREILPAIKASRFKEYLPKDGSGSRDGWAEEIAFTHGPALKFMSAGGGDEKRSSYTARVVVLTEVDKMDEAGASSREADPVSQLEARTLSYDDSERLLYMECTVSIPTGRIWQEYNAGTASRIACPCPHCGEYVTPEREHLVGWQEATSKMDARRRAHFVCPACSKPLSPEQRVEMNQGAKLLHRGQSIDRKGRISGDPPDTDTLGFRWNAFNNLFWSPGSIGAKEWAALHAEDEDAAEKELLQFYWATPYKPPEWDETPLTSQATAARVRKFPRGVVPVASDYLTVGIDLGKYCGHFVAAAWLNDKSGHVVDYGVFDVPSVSLGVEQAIVSALRTMRDLIEAGWMIEGTGETRVPDRVFIDARYHGQSVYIFVREAGRRYLPAIGHGVSQERKHWYNQPKSTGATVKKIGLEYHIAWVPKDRMFVVESNADYWKSWLHQRLAIPLWTDGEISYGAVSFFQATAREHITIAKHITNEKIIEEYVPGRGVVQRWVNEGRRPNHYFDAFYNACTAAHLCGFRLVEAEMPAIAQESSAPPRPRLTLPDGRPYLITEREG